MQRLFTVGPAQNGMRLIDFLASRLEISGKRAKRLLDDRSVFVNDRRVWMAKHTVRRGDRVELHLATEPRKPRRIEPVFEDSSFLIADKPPGLLSNGPDSLEQILRTERGIPGLAAVRRLDRDTSGCILFAKTSAARESAIELFQRGEITKIYHAIVAGPMPLGSRDISTPLEGREALTQLRVLSASRRASHLSIRLATGRTHQIRKHLSAIGHPVVGDRMYATGIHELPELRNAPRQMLHAAVLSLPHPVTGERIRAEASLPADFRACLGRLRLG